MTELRATGHDDDPFTLLRSRTVSRRRLANFERAFYRSEKGRHGSSILYDDPTSWIAVEQFLKSLPN